LHPAAEWEMVSVVMATYALGDIHGCWETLSRLLAKIELDPSRDRLWLVGDLVNRGPSSLEVLRWARDLSAEMGERMVAVLGNHDTYLLALHAGAATHLDKDTLLPVLEAPDRGELLAWLRQRPFLHRDGETLLVHAGLWPEWDLEQAVAAARDLEQALQGPDLPYLLGRTPPWSDRQDTEIERRRWALAAFTRLRTCTPDGHPCRFSGPPQEAPKGCYPWFEVPGRRHRPGQAVCGHWAAQGLRLEGSLLALDSGCVWGECLTALRLEDRRVFQQPVCEPPGSLPER
jgi:bis(5'-nucleosyl)-tetraphosphatase (symmetrical)